MFLVTTLVTFLVLRNSKVSLATPFNCICNWIRLVADVNTPGGGLPIFLELLSQLRWTLSGASVSMKLKLELKLIYNRQSASQSVWMSDAHLGPMTNFSFSLKFPSDSCGFAIL
jgi:hypothetical protein